MSWVPPKSPYNLIQEHLWKDPWKIFVACIFCNLTRRVDAEPYIWKFFDKYPDPKTASQADESDLQYENFLGKKTDNKVLLKEIPEEPADKKSFKEVTENM